MISVEKVNIKTAVDKLKGVNIKCCIYYDLNDLLNITDLDFKILHWIKIP